MPERPVAELEQAQYVVRAGLARASTLIDGTGEHSLLPGLTGFSVQSAPGVSVQDLARGGGFRNRQISVTTREALVRHGFDLLFPTPGRGAYHATVRVPYPLPVNIAELLASLFVQTPNPYPVS